MFAFTKLMQAMVASGSVSDPQFYLTTLLLNTSSTNGAQNNTFLDSSTNNFTITRNGNVTQGTFTPFSQTGWSNYFGGSDYLTAPSGAAVSGNSAFTVEFWVFMPVSNSISRIVSGAANQFTFNISSDGSMTYGKNGVVDVITVGAGTSMIGQWNHIVIGKSGASGTARIWRNGTSVGTATDSQTYTAGTVYIGSTSVPSGYLTGYISNLRITNTDVYGTSNTSITVPITPLTAVTGTSLLTSQDNRFKDNSTNAFAITTSGTPSVQAFSPFLPTAAYSTSVVGGSGYFDGTGDYLTYTTPSSVVRDWWVNDFTLEAWIYPTTLTGWDYLDSSIRISTVIGNASATTNDNYWSFGPINTGAVRLYYYNGAAVLVTSTETVKVNQWNHISFTKNSAGIRIFVNGVGTTATAVSGTPQSGNTYPLTIGQINSTSCNGYIAGARIVNGTALYTSNFAPPIAPPTAVTNTQLLLNYTNSGIFDSTAKNDLETVGNAQVSTTQAKWGTTSLGFDGTGDWLFLNSNAPSPIALGGGNFTVEMWLYPNSSYSGAYAGIMDSRTSGDGAGLVYFGYTGTANQIGWKDNTTNVVTGTVTQSAWNHVAVVRDSGTLKLYINGSLASSGSNSTNYTAPFKYIGSSFDPLAFNGYIDDLRITRGYARYSGSTYTQPAAAFPLQ